MAKLFVDAGSRFTFNAASRIISQGNLELMRLALDENSRLQYSNYGIDDRTLLHYAVHKGDLPMIELLLERGADPTARTQAGETPADWIRYTKIIPHQEKLIRETLQKAKENRKRAVERLVNPKRVPSQSINSPATVSTTTAQRRREHPGKRKNKVLNFLGANIGR
jgi:ankyrin repeat protein